MSIAELPVGWTMTSLGEVVDQSTEKVDPQTQPEAPFIGMEHIEAHTMRMLAPACCRDFKSLANVFRPGQVLYGRLRPYLNKVLVPDLAGACSGELIVLQPTKAICAQYLAYLLNYQSFVTFAGTLDTGDRPRVKYDQIAAYQFALPPIEEQRLIVAFLESRIDLVSRAVTEIAAAERLMSVFRTSALRALAHTAFRRSRIDAVGEVFVGATPKRDDPNLWGGDIPWVTSSEVAFCRISATKEAITEAGLGNRERRLHPPETVLLAMYGEGKTRGQAAVLGLEAATNQAVAAIRLDRDKMRPEFLYLCLLRQYDEVRKFGRGGQQLNLNKELVQSIEVPRPDVDVQDELIETVRAELALCEDQGVIARTTLSLARSLRTALVRDALAGRTTPRVAGAKPADQLVAEVQDLRASQLSTKRRRRPVTAAA